MQKLSQTGDDSIFTRRSPGLFTAEEEEEDVRGEINRYTSQIIDQSSSSTYHGPTTGPTTGRSGGLAIASSRSRRTFDYRLGEIWALSA